MADGTDSGSAERRRAVVSVERAVLEFRCGRPVCIAAADGGRSLALATELATQERIDALRVFGDESDPRIVLTHNRAATLKIRLYTPEAVCLPFPDWLSAEQIRRLADPQFDLAEPLRGPFLAEREPVSEAVLAGVRLAKTARLLPSTLCVRLDAVGAERAAAEDFAEIDASDIAVHDAASVRSLRRVAAARVPLAACEDSRIVVFLPHDGGLEHLAIVVGEPSPSEPVLARLHSQCFTGDLLGSLKCDCGDQLRGALELFAKKGAGILLYLPQEGRGIGLANKLRAYALQDQGFDTVEANQRLGFEDDERDFMAAAEMLHQLGHGTVRLLTNNPRKVAQLERCGIAVAKRVEHAFPTNVHNELYLAVKTEKSGHLIPPERAERNADGDSA